MKKSRSFPFQVISIMCGAAQYVANISSSHCQCVQYSYHKELSGVEYLLDNTAYFIRSKVAFVILMQYSVSRTEYHGNKSSH